MTAPVYSPAGSKGPLWMWILFLAAGVLLVVFPVAAVYNAGGGDFTSGLRAYYADLVIVFVFPILCGNILMVPSAWAIAVQVRSRRMKSMLSSDNRPPSVED